MLNHPTLEKGAMILHAALLPAELRARSVLAPKAEGPVPKRRGRPTPETGCSSLAHRPR